MPIISECSEPGCEILTIGDYCIEHERERDADDPIARELTADQPPVPVPQAPLP